MRTLNRFLLMLIMSSFFLLEVNQINAQITNYPYIQDFGSSSCSRPNGYNNTGSSPWDFQNTSEMYMEGLDHTSNGGCFASMDDSGGQVDDSCVLTTPIFDLTSIPFAQLHFWWQNSNATNSVAHASGPRPWSNLYVDVSTDGGLTWMRNAWQVEDSQQIGWVRASMPLTPYISNQTVLRFRGLETRSYFSDMSLDDIKIFQPEDYDVGITEIADLRGNCAGTIPVNAKLKNFGRINLTSAVINWTVNGIPQTPVTYTGSLPYEGVASISLGNISVANGISYDIVAWSSMPNGKNDNILMNDTAKSLQMETALSGTYTVGVNGNFNSISELATALTKRGVCGSVIANVDSATYVGKATFGPIVGTSASNTITINGNGATLMDSTSSAERHLIRLDNASYLTIDNLSITALSTTFGYGIHLTNQSNYNTIQNCTVDLTSISSTSSSNGAGIVASGSNNSTTSEGNNANYCTFSNNTILGGLTGLYYGIRLNGEKTGKNCKGNMVLNNTISNIRNYNIFLYNTDSSIISGNDISRAGKTDVSTFYGIYVSSGNRNALVEKNTIHNTHDMASYKFGGSYGIYFSSCDAPQNSPNIVKNNLLYNFNSNSSNYGFYNISSDGVYYYHNTVSFDHAASTGGIVRGFYQSGVASNIRFQNNIISITQGGSSTKHGIYLSSSSSSINCDFNCIYLNSSGSGNQYIGRWGLNNFSSLSNWQTANGQAFGQNSDSFSPNFVDINTDDYTPNSFSINDAALPIAGISEDLYSIPRSVTPDIGAIEFLPVPLNDRCDKAFSVSAGTTWGTTIRSTIDTISACGTPLDSSGGVWFVYEGNGTFVNASLCGAAFNTKLSVYSGTCGALQCITGNDDSCNTQSMVGWCSDKNVNYYLYVHGADTAKGDFDLTITETPVVQPSVSVSPDTIICANITATLTADSATAYLWDNLNTNRVRMVNDSGAYFVTTTDTNGCLATSEKVNISLLPLPIVNLGNDTSICENDVLVLDAGLAGTYQWSTGETARYIVYRGSSGTATITVKATDDNGCEKIDQLLVTVNICTGIAENALGSTINIFPNPNDGIFFVELKDLPPGTAMVNVMDIKGQVVHSEQLTIGTPMQTKLDLTDLNKGMYMIRINVANNWYTGKLIIE